MNLRRDWPWIAGAVGGVGALLGISMLAAHLSDARPLPAGAPLPSKPVDPQLANAPNPRGHLLGSDAIVVRKGRTYFATLETNGAVDTVASVSAIKSQAEKLGFNDVVVFEKGQKPAEWPQLDTGDYVVRATFNAPDARAFPRHVSVFLGSANVLDAWEV